MIAEEFNALDWGSIPRATAARTRREKELKEAGYEVFKRNLRALNRRANAYQLLAIPPNINIRPVLPGAGNPTRSRRRNTGHPEPSRSAIW